MNDDPALNAQLVEVQTKLAAARQDAANLRTQIEDWKDRVKSDRAGMIVSGERQVEEALDLLKQHERKVSECEALLVKAEKAVAGLERQEAAVRELILVP